MENWREIQAYCIIQCATVRLGEKTEVARNGVTVPEVGKRLPRLNIKIKLHNSITVKQSLFDKLKYCCRIYLSLNALIFELG